RLGPRNPSLGWPVVISGFLQSMARTCAARSIAIILSGMGYDGSDQLGAIKRAGGTTVAQSDAQFRSMPRAAVATGQIDWQLSARDIGKRLALIPSNNKTHPPPIDTMLRRQLGNAALSAAEQPDDFDVQGDREDMAGNRYHNEGWDAWHYQTI